MAVAASAASAHHSFAMFDKEHPVELQGTVKSWEFTNPHSWLVMVVMKNGRPTEINVEGASVLTLVRQGFGLNTFAPGEKLDLVISPLKNGGPGGAFVKATKSDGTVLTESPTPN
ncbi:MAG TPA: DUF6152 family protein [Phenylobacterium sp.]|uniref:DUF6152 family protein n=1 Tax=Phenylobacterium sp. TaxID=1871053 RepID=UPI002BC7F58F|nr:DUF6152 family protein [Phenylobacterium sp.]HXA40549.1 DUF6152 family protein [Phenylobacterium sp.]